MQLISKLMKNIKITVNEENCSINYDNYYFNGMFIPKVIRFNDFSPNSFKIFWKIEDFKIENIDKDNIIFKVEIRKENSNEKFTKVYEGSNYNCLIENLNTNTVYEIRICCIYKDIIGPWSDI